MQKTKKIVIILAFFIVIAVIVVAWVYYSSSLTKAKSKNFPINQTAEEGPTTVIKDIVSTIIDKVTNKNQDNNNQYNLPVHKNISVTYFWVGEDATKDNKEISNSPSAWDEKWVQHFGGVDDPKKRNNFFPEDFVPKENPFYFALPYDDFDKKGNHKKEIATLIPWSKGKSLGKLESICKNQWIKITKGDKVVYAQWEDVGPFKEDDASYVFGNDNPKSKTNKKAGLDVSPAVKDYLSLSDVDKVDWQFVDVSLVPDGPWKKIITSSQVYWE